MPDTTDIEKKSLEAHVELCAQRYKFIEEQLERVDLRFTKLEALISEVHNMVQKFSEKRNDQLLAWGLVIITSLLGIIGWLLSHYVFI